MVKISKFNKSTVKPQVTSPVTTTGPTGTTFEGATGYGRDAKSELFLLAVSNFVSEDTFYEKAAARDERFEDLVKTVAVQDPAWMSKFIPWLRNEANMRSASLVAAAEAARTMVNAKIPGGRQLINSAISRADEPGEFLAYWVSKHGKQLPMAVKRGVADAAVRLYNERSLLKYDTASKGFRFSDVIELTHPDPRAPRQDRLFKFAIDRRHGDAVADDGLPIIQANAALRTQVAKYHMYEAPLNPETLAAAGFTWEDALSLGGSHLDKAQLWEAMIPSMGFMALLRNLRNFDEAGVSDKVALMVQAKLMDPDEVARSRQFPFRFLSAFKAAPSLRWAYPLEAALNLSLSNVPQLPGRTLILIDTSGSMIDKMSDKSGLVLWEAAALFGIAVSSRCEKADVVSYSNLSQHFPLVVGESVLKGLDRFRRSYFYGGGTQTGLAVKNNFRAHDRVIVLTDEQADFGGSYDGGVDHSVPTSVPFYTWNLAGYKYGHAPSGKDHRHAFGGLTDKAFKMIPLIEAGRSADWDTLFGS